MKVLVVGGGAGGLATAIHLRLAGHDVHVVERNPEGVTYGWGILSPESLDPTYGTDPGTVEAIAQASHGHRGAVVQHPTGRREWMENEGHTIERHRLLEVLTSRVRALGATVEFGREVGVQEIEDDTEHDLIVVSNGVNSPFRAAHAAEFGTETRNGENYYVWLGTTKMFRSFTFVAVRSEAGWLGCHAYGYDPDRSTVIVECPVETWKNLGLGDLGAREGLKVLEELFSDALDGHPLMLQQRDLDLDQVPWLRYLQVRNEHWHLGKVVLVGDAAHTTHFSIGSGTRLAYGDAHALVEELGRHDDLNAALDEYESRRRADIRLAQRDAEYSARFLENVDRYARYDVDRFASLFHWRQSPYLAKLPVRPYHRLRKTIENNPRAYRALRRTTAFRRGFYVKRHTH